jgi:type III secretory pathway component EscS
MSLDPNVAVVIVSVIGIVVPVMTTLTKFVQDRRIAADAARKVEDVRKDLKTQGDSVTQQLAVTAESVEKIHVAVNSERTAMLAKIEAMHGEIRVLTQALTQAQERGITSTG